MPGGIEGDPTAPGQQDLDPLPPVEEPKREPRQRQPRPPRFDSGRARLAAERLVGFPRRAIASAPETTAWFSTNRAIANHRAPRFGPSLATASEYLDDLSRFNGQPGYLRSQYVKARKIKDPGIQKEADRILDQLRDLKEPLQSEITPYLEGTAPFRPGYSDEEIFDFIFGPNTEIEEGVVTVEGDIQSGSVSVDTIAALQVLFPKLKIEFDMEDTYREGFLVAYGDEALERSGSLSAWSQAALDYQRGDKSLLDFTAETLTVGSRAIPELGWSLGGDALTGIGLDGVRNYIDQVMNDVNFAIGGTFIKDGKGGVIPVSRIEDPETHEVTWVDDNGAPVDPNKTPVQSGILTEIIDGGMDPSDPEYDDNMTKRGAALILVGGIATHLAGELGSRVHLARHSPDVGYVGAVLDESLPVHRTGVLGQVAEVYRAPSRAAQRRINELVLKFARDPEKYFAEGFRGRHGRRLLDTMDEARVKYPDDLNAQAGFVWARFKNQLHPETIKKMVRTGSREGAFRAWMDDLVHNPAKRRAEVDASRQAIIDIDKRMQEAVDPHRENLGVDDDLNAANSAVDERTVTYEGEDTQGAYMTERAAQKKAIALDRATDATDLGGGVHKYTDAAGNEIYVLLDDDGRVLASREVSPSGETTATTLDGESGKGYGKTLGLAHWQDKGLTLGSKELSDYIAAQTYSGGGAGLTKSMLRTLAEGKRLDVPVDTISRLRAERWIHEQRINRSGALDIPQVYPRMSGVRNVMEHAPKTKFGRFMDTILTGTHLSKGFLDLRKFNDDLASRPQLRVPGSKNYGLDGAQENIATLSTFLRRAGVDAETIRMRVGQMINEKMTREDFYRLIEHDIFGADGDIAQAWRRLGMDDGFIREALQLHDNPLDVSYDSTLHSVIDTPAGPALADAPVVSKRLDDGSIISQPSRPTDFLNRPIMLPSVDTLIDATSFIRRTLRRLEKAGLAGKTAKGAYDTIKLAMATTTMLLKPIVLVSRFPALIMRIQMEQGLRAYEYGFKPFAMPQGLSILPGGIPIPLTKHRLLEGFFGDDGIRLLDPDPRYRGLSNGWDNTAVGMFANDVQGETQKPMLVDMGRVNAGKAEPTARQYRGWADEVEHAEGDWLDTHLASDMWDDLQSGADGSVEAFLDSILLTKEGREFMDGMNAVLEGNGQPGTLRQKQLQWIENRKAYLEQLAGGDNDVLAYIGSGRFPAGTLPAAKKVDDQVRMEHTTAVNDVNRLNDEIKRLSRKDAEVPDGTTRSALLKAAQAERKVALRKARRLERKHDGLKETRTIGESDLTLQLRRRFEAGSARFPQKIRVKAGYGNRFHGDGALNTLHRSIEGVSHTLYRGLAPVSWVDKHGTRGSLFSQAYAREMGVLKRMGYSEVDARALAYVRAARQTRDSMYDLNLRTSFHRATKDWFWFAPATQEILTTWLVKIPSRSYWPLGLAKVGADIGMLYFGLKALGVIDEMEDGTDVIRVPRGFASAINKLMPGNLPDDAFVFGKATGLNVVLQNNGLPGLSTAGNFLVGKAALEWGGPFKVISDWFQPYGPETGILPMPLVHLHEAIFGEPPPWEWLSGDYQDYQFRRASDEAMRFAYSELYHDGVRAPKPDDYKTEAEYNKAKLAWLNRLTSTARGYQQGISWFRFMGSVASPTQLYVTTEEKEEWEKFWNDIVGEPGAEGYTEAQREVIEGYLDENPGSLSYNTYYSLRGEADRELPFPESEDDNFFDDWYTGQYDVMEPEDYAETLLASESKRFYQSRLRGELRRISPTNDPWELLRHGYEKGEALLDYREDWDRFLFLNPEVRGRLDVQARLWAEERGLPVRSYEAQRLSDTLFLLRRITPMLTGQENIRPQALRNVMGQISELYSETGEFGEANTKTEKAIGWWMDNVLEPYLDDTEALYAEADRLTSLGISAGPIYDQIREISNAPVPKYQGRNVPSVEEFFFGNKTQEEQEATRYTWATRPVHWLSDFQAEKLDYSLSTSDREFLASYAQAETDFYAYVDANNIATGSLLYDAVEKSYLEYQKFNASQYGESAEELLRLNQAQPFVRLDRAGFAEGNEGWDQAVDSAAQAVAFIKSEGMSTKGFSQDVAMPAKMWFYTTINTLRDRDQAFDDLMTELSYSMPLHDGLYREGALLYEAIFFGNFRETDIPDELTELGAL